MKNREPSIEEMLQPAFTEASFVAHEKSGRWRIPNDQRALLGESYYLSEGQTAAFAFFGEIEAEETLDRLDWDCEIDRGALYE